MAKENTRKKYDFELQLDKINLIRLLIGYLILGLGMCLALTIIGAPLAIFIMATGHHLTIRHPKCPNCNKPLKMKYNDIVLHCKKCKENININWVK